jgi:hypothetical protein
MGKSTPGAAPGLRESNPRVGGVKPPYKAHSRNIGANDCVRSLPV